VPSTCQLCIQQTVRLNDQIPGWVQESKERNGWEEDPGSGNAGELRGAGEGAIDLHHKNRPARTRECFRVEMGVRNGLGAEPCDAILSQVSSRGK